MFRITIPYSLHRFPHRPLTRFFMSKLVFYTFHLSVWSCVAELAMSEAEYPPDAVERKIVHLAKGSNFDPEFLKINPKGTVPTLIVDGKLYDNSTDITKYLIDHGPKKLEAQPGNPAFIEKLHQSNIDPGLILLVVRNDEEVKKFASSWNMEYAQNRRNALENYSKTEAGAPYKKLYDDTLPMNELILSVYKGEASEAQKNELFRKSTDHWNNIANFIRTEIPAALPEAGFIGGSVPGEADFHLMAWLARVGFMAGGKPEKGGYVCFEKETKEPVPPRLAGYWDAWTERASWKRLYSASLH